MQAVFSLAPVSALFLSSRCTTNGGCLADDRLRVPREQKMLKGHLPRVIYHQVYEDNMLVNPHLSCGFQTGGMCTLRCPNASGFATRREQGLSVAWRCSRRGGWIRTTQWLCRLGFRCAVRNTCLKLCRRSLTRTLDPPPPWWFRS